MCFAMDIEYGGGGIGPETAGPNLVGNACKRNILAQINTMVQKDMSGINFSQDMFPSVDQPLESFGIINLIVEMDLSIHNLYPIVRYRQILTGEPPVNRMGSHLAQDETRRDRRRIRGDLVFVGFAEQLYMTHGKGEAGFSPIIIVDRQGLLEFCWIGSCAQAEHGGAQVLHEISAYLAAAVGKSLRVIIVGAFQQESGRVDRPARNDEDGGFKPHGFIVVGHFYIVDFLTIGGGHEAFNFRPGEQRNVIIGQ